MCKIFNKKAAFINPEAISFMSDLKREYSDCIKTPYKGAKAVLEILMYKFDLHRELVMEKLDNITYATLDTLPINISCTTEIYIVEDNEKSHDFYLYFHSRYALQPRLCIVYDEKMDTLCSNCSLLEMYITILHGIDIHEIECDSVKYHNYLNTLYSFDMCRLEG